MINLSGCLPARRIMNVVVWECCSTDNSKHTALCVHDSSISIMNMRRIKKNCS
jgi:hypothetical protein